MRLWLTIPGLADGNIVCPELLTALGFAGGGPQLLNLQSTNSSITFNNAPTRLHMLRLYDGAGNQGDAREHE